MIQNERQYKITSKQVGSLISSLDTMVVNTNEPEWLIKAQSDALNSQIDDLKSELVEYDLLKNGKIRYSEHSDLSSLPLVLIQSRIAKGLSQKDLGDILKMTQQQIQRYEATNYMGASLSRLIEIADVLEVSVQEIWGESEPKNGNSIFSWNNPDSVDWNKFPIKEMISRDWLDLNQHKSPTMAVQDFFINSAGPQYISALHRKKFHGENTPNEYALLAWQARVLDKAREEVESGNIAEFDHSDTWVTDIVKLSAESNAPIKVKEYLASKGIALIIEKHLKGTYLDGAAMLLETGTPVVALTLRYDRLDNFWFVLFHELGHVFLHLFDSLRMDFFDEENVTENDEIEREADQFALDKLISSKSWESCLSRFSMTKESVETDAKNLGIHPSIIAGRIRKERKKYTVLQDLVGQGTVRSLFEY